MKNPKTMLIAVGAIALLLVGFLFVRGPKPIIEIKAEKLADIGPFPLVNTYVTSTLALIVIIALAYWMTRNVNIIPSKLQNLIESVVEAMYNICVNAAGPENARRFFPVVMTIFTFIWIANWMALLPFFNAIGGVQKVDAHHFHEEAVLLDTAGGLSFINLNEKSLEFEVEETEAWTEYEHLGEEITDAKTEGVAAGEIHTLEEEREAALEHAREQAILEELHDKEVVPEDVTELETALTMIEEDGKELGILIPYFRSMNTDINSPLSIAIMAMIFVEFWGITALGFFKYGAKFINFSSPINFIVGILELVAEIARLISFTFRLFGNMLAGEILLLVMTFLVPFLVALPFYGLEMFVGVIQAFVFAMLTLVFGVLAASSHEGHDELGGHDDPDRPLEGPVPVMH